MDFVRDVLPILAKNCQACHGPSKQKGGLRLDSGSAVRRGGDAGPAIKPGASAASLLIHRVAGVGEGHAMPPNKDARLSPEAIGLLRSWIDQGADWPAASGQQSAEQSHWAFRQIARPVAPVATNGGARSPIDRFVLARLAKEGIAPSPEADKATLLRRLHLDLTGLPPTPKEIDAFLQEDGPDAFERLVDRLLQSPHFGERWAGHWLDLARYADSDGYENDRFRPHAWRWRDWVIRAINSDLPFDQFTIQQIAGDLLPSATAEQRAATGFHRNVLHNSAGGADAEEFRTKAVKDMIDTVGVVWMGLTVGCAQCHTHKYDPISQREYYQLYAFFNCTDGGDVPFAGGQAPAVKARQRATQIHVRGDFLKPGEVVQAGTPAFLPSPKLNGKPSTGVNRLDLARWLVDPSHPLAARVAVNHVWKHLFGRGLVATPENFGIKGEPASHPELLDWLAAEFVALKWSRKELLRRIVTSSTYRQSSRHRPELADKDPSNTLLARQNRFVVEAEVVRDLALVASGLLRPEIGGPSVQPPLPRGLASRHDLMSEQFMQESKGRDRYRRGVYIQRQRTFPYPMLLAFDCPDGNAACAKRDRSTTPIQALTLLNDPVFIESAQALARRLLREPAASETQRLYHAFRICLARPPDEQESALLGKLIEQRRAQYAKPSAATGEVVGTAPLPPGAAPADMAVWVSVARTLLNVEEFITRE